MAKMALMVVQSSTGRPSFAQAAEQLGVSAGDIDPKFGIILIDTKNLLYAVKVRADKLPPGIENAIPFRGPYSDLTIEPLAGEARSGALEPSTPPSDPQGTDKEP